jgi:hypothetical protein
MNYILKWIIFEDQGSMLIVRCSNFIMEEEMQVIMEEEILFGQLYYYDRSIINVRTLVQIWTKLNYTPQYLFWIRGSSFLRNVLQKIIYNCC